MKPDAYYVSDSTTKGLSLSQIRDFGLTSLSMPPDSTLTVRAAYTDVGFFRRCVDVRARTVATLPFALYRGETSVWDDTSPQPKDLDWLRLYGHAFRSSASLALAGAAYAFIERSGRRIDRLVWFSPETVKPEYTPQGIASFTRQVGAKRYTIAAEDVWHAFAPDAYTEQGPGSTDGAAAKIHAQVLADLAGYTSDQLRSGLVKKTVFVAPGARPPEDARKEVESWLWKLLGPGVTRPRVIGGDLKAQQIGSDLSDLAADAISVEHQRAIATTLGVPHSLVMSDAANYATARADQINFITTTIASDARTIADALNEQVLAAYGLELRYEPSRLEVMQQHEAEKAQHITALVLNGILTVDEAREQLGYPPIPAAARAVPSGAGEASVGGTSSAADAARSADLRRWRAKVERAGPAVKFEPDHLSPAEADVIRTRLAAGMPIDDAFGPPFSDF